MKLYFFTSSYPFGINEPFIEAELGVLAGKFNEIEIFPFYYNNKITQARPVPDNVIVNRPVIPLKRPVRVVYFLKSLIKIIPLTFFIKEFFKYKVYTKKERIKNWGLTLVDFCILWDSNYIKKLNEISNSIFYFYWGNNWALSMCYLKKKEGNHYFVRLHGGEVYIERSYGYIPKRKILFKNADFLLTISGQLKEYLINRYSIPENKIYISRLGTYFIALNPHKKSDIYRIVSVSNLVPLKRVDLIISVFSQITEVNIEWYHFGDGIEFEKLNKMAAAELGSNINYKFFGNVSNKTIKEFYIAQPLDAFINLSRYEGVPVSIMEANSFGIPTVATDVGATKEIVTNEIGALLPVDEKIEKIKDIILSIKTDDWVAKREKCFKHWQMYYNAEVNYESLADILKQKK